MCERKQPILPQPLPQPQRLPRKMRDYCCSYRGMLLQYWMIVMYLARHVESASDNVFLRQNRTPPPTPTMHLAPTTTPSVSQNDSVSFSDGDNSGTNSGTITFIVFASTFLIGLFVLLSARRCRQRNVSKPECYMLSYISTTNSFATSNGKEENEPSLMSSEENYDIENQHGMSGYDIDAHESEWYLENSHPSARTRIIYDCDEEIVYESSPAINGEFSDGETHNSTSLSFDIPELDDTRGTDDNESEIYAGAMVLLFMTFQQCQQYLIQQEESDRYSECLLLPDDNETTTRRNEHEFSNVDQPQPDHVVVDLTESDHQSDASDHDCYEFLSSVHYEGVFTQDLPTGLSSSDSDEDDIVDGNDEYDTTNIFDLLQHDAFDNLWNQMDECEEDHADGESSDHTVHIGPIDIDSGENVRDTNGLDGDDVGENDVFYPSKDHDNDHGHMEDYEHNVTNSCDALPHAQVHVLPNLPVDPVDVVMVSDVRSGPIDIDSGQVVVVAVVPVTAPRSPNHVTTKEYGRSTRHRPTIQKRRPSVKALRDDYFRRRHAIRTRRSSSSSVQHLSSIVEEMTETDDVVSVSSFSSSVTTPGRDDLLVI